MGLSNRMKIARQAATLVSKRANHQTQFGFGAMDFWSFLGTTKAKSAVTPYAEAPQAACTSKVAISTDSVDQGACANQARVVANAENEPAWYLDFYKWKFRQDYMGHDTKYGLLIDDNRDILINDYADMRDRMYDDARQDYHYRVTVGDYRATAKEILPYEEWAPLSAGHHYLNDVGKQYQAEKDEKEIVNHATGKAGLFDMPPFSYRTFLRNRSTYKKAKADIDESVLRSQ